MKKIIFFVLIGVFTSAGAIASDCSFKITQERKLNDCERSLGRNCYKVSVPVIESIIQALKPLGFTTEIIGAEKADLEIDLAVASKYIPGPPYRGIGYLSVEYADNKRSTRSEFTKQTREMNRTRMFKKLSSMVGEIPESIPFHVRKCL